MEAEATIIDLRRASAHERMARSRAKQKKEKRAVKRRIREREAAATIIDLWRASARERIARSHAKQKEAKRAVERRIRECEAEAGNGINPPTLTSTSTAMGAPTPTTTMTGPGVSVTFTLALNFCLKGGASWMFEKILEEPFSANAHNPTLPGTAQTHEDIHSFGEQPSQNGQRHFEPECHSSSEQEKSRMIPNVCQSLSPITSYIALNFSDEEEIGAWIWKTSRTARLSGANNSEELL
jgi:hypothetical protein